MKKDRLMELAGVQLNEQTQISDRIDQVQGLEYDDALKLIFEWVKTKVITLKEFKTLIQANRDAV